MGVRQARPVTITGGRLVQPGGVREGAIRLVDGRIAALGEIAPQEGDEVVAARGRLIAPGLVDYGVFAVDKPAFHFGGITRAALMPDQRPPLDLPSRVSHIAKSGKPDLWVHPLAAATQGLAGEALAELALMREAGARGVATGRRWIASSGVMLRLLGYAAMTRGLRATRSRPRGRWRPGWASPPRRPRPRRWRSRAISRWRSWRARGCTSARSPRARASRWCARPRRAGWR
jgi:dihydroorotase-like cyclic amidohydrolase